MKKNLFLIILACILFISGIGVLGYTMWDYHESSVTKHEMAGAFSDAVEKNIDSKVTIIKAPTVDENGNKLIAGTDIAILEPSEEVILAKKREEYANEHRYFENMLMVAQIDIPTIKSTEIAVEGTGSKLIAKAIGHFSDTAGPGEYGNFALCGHRGGKHGEFWINLTDLRDGDEVIVTNIYGDEFKYYVYDTAIIEATDFSVLKPRRDDIREMTMITCTNNGKQRYVVRAVMADDLELVE